MNRQKWFLVVVLMVTTGTATAGAGHGNVPSARPPAVCVQVRGLS